MCVAGSYAKNGIGEECVKCPSGGYCPGGIERPYPKTGFWGDKSCEFFPEFGNSTCQGFDNFVECNPPSNCAGGVDFSCSEGHSGPLCKQAQSGWFIVGGSFWFECGDNGHFVGVVGIVCVVLVWLTINKVASGNYDAMDIALLFVQITGMISTFGLKWHANLSLVNTALGIANFDVDFVTPLCLGKWTSVDSFFVQLFLPAIYAMGCAIYYGLVYVWRRYVVLDSSKTIGEWRQCVCVNLINKPASFILVMYHTLCLKCFQIFSCETFPDGRQFMRFSPDIECWQGDHIGMVVMSVIYIPTVLIGFPVYLVYVIRKASDNGTLHDPNFMDKFSFAFSRYDPGYKWWEAVLIFRRFAIALISVAPLTSLLQAAISIILLVTLLTWHSHTRPFVSDKIDNLEVFTLCGSIFYALAGMLFYPSITAEAQGYICTDDQFSVCSNELSLKNVISIVLVTWIVLTLVYAFWTSFLCVNEVNDSAKADKMLKGMLGILTQRNASFMVRLPFDSSMGSFSISKRKGSVVGSVFGSFLSTRSSARVSEPPTPSAPREGGNGAIHSVPFESTADEVAEVAASVERSLEEAEAGVTVDGTVPKTESSAQFTKKFGELWESSSNRMTLQDVVQGKDMLNWAREVKLMRHSDKRKCLIDFEVVTLRLLSLEQDVTHYAESEYADICRHIASHEGVVDYLSSCPDVERKALALFMEGYAGFMQERSEMTDRKKGMSLFPLGAICLPENMSVLVSYLANSTTEDVARLTHLLREISGLKEGKNIGETPCATPGLMTPATSRSYRKDNAVAPLPTHEGAGKSPSHVCVGGPTAAASPHNFESGNPNIRPESEITAEEGPECEGRDRSADYSQMSTEEAAKRRQWLVSSWERGQQ